MRAPPLIPALALALLAGCATPPAAPAAGPTPATAPADNVKLTALPDRVRIEIGGQLFSEYVFAGAHRPYFYPVLSADGTPLTRDFPMQDTPGEDHDHPHHRSLWFAHSNVDGIDFWNEGKAGSTRPKGSIIHASLDEVTSGPAGTIRATDRWVAPDGTLICTDQTTILVRGTAAARYLDYTVTVHALPGKPLFFGDDKDGTMAIRVAQWMTLPHKNGKVDEPGVGHIITSAGDRDAAAWGKRADWADYYAPRAGKTYGVAIFDDPRNLRHPTWWMARDYGLFGANPFGKHFYENTSDPHSGDYTLPAGGSLTFRYFFYFHEGDPTAAGVAQLYHDYALARQ